VRFEGLVRVIGAVVLGVATALISYLVLDSIGGGQVAAVMAVLIFIVAAVAFSWAFR
jgi:hypothetical protein